MLTLTASSLPAKEQATVVLVRDRQPVATIVVATQPTCAAQYAARELQDHIERISGAKLPIVADTHAVEGVRVLVGASRLTTELGIAEDSLEMQEYLIRFLPQTVVLMGRDANRRTQVAYEGKTPADYATWPGFFEAQGTCYAVFDFLERYCGVRWFRPGDLGRVCPPVDTLAVSGPDIRRAPAIKHRKPYPILQGGDYDRSTGLWDWGSSPGRDQEPFQAGLALAYPEWTSGNAAERAGIARRFLHRLRLGGEDAAYNHSFYGFYDRFWRMNPARTNLFEGARPAWFAQGYGAEGSEKPTAAGNAAAAKPPPQMCYSHPDFIRQVIQDARDFFDGKGAKPGAAAAGDTFGVAPMDNSLWCRCPECQKQLLPEAVRGRGLFSNDRASDYIFPFVNRVAREIRKTHPDKFLTIPGYSEYAFPPTREPLDPNVMVSLCLHVRAPYAPRVVANDRGMLDTWRQQAPNHPFIAYLYYLFPVYSAKLANFNCFPGFFAHTVDTWFKRFDQSGVFGVFFEGLGHDVEVYVTCKLMDDPTQDVDALLDDYFTGLYGPAAAPMKAFYLDVETIFSDPANYLGDDGHQTAEIAWERLGTAARMATLAEHVMKARAAARTDAEKARVALFEQQVWAYMTTGRERYLVRQQTVIPSLTAPRVPDAGGDAAKVDWEAAAVLRGWQLGENVQAERRVEARLAHDTRFLYLQLTDSVDTRTLKIDHANICNDDWEIFFARQRAKPYRQLGIGPTGKTFTLAWGEAEGSGHSPWDSGAAVVSDISAPDRWSSRAALPLERLLPGGVKAGETFYMNILRIWNTTGTSGGWRLVTWVPLSGVHQTDRLGEIRLE